MQPLINYWRLVLHPGADTLRFALRTIVACLLTLYLAFIFDLDQPKWSIMAVFIVSQPLGGMTLQRSFAQVVGTTLGAAVAVLIMALFPQAPLPFIITLALWLALCTAGGTLLRYTSSHAFVLSGFTAVVVAMLAIPEQDNTLMLAITRVTETLLAVACVCAVSLLSARPQAVASGYFAKVDNLIKLMASHAAAAIRGEESAAEFSQRQMQILGEISALEGLRRHLYFDAPHLRGANGLVQLLGNQLVLLSSRLTVLRNQKLMIAERWQGDYPQFIRRLLADELAFLDLLAQQGRALPAEAREHFSALQRRFDQAALQAEQLQSDLPTPLRSLAWALRWEQARLLEQLGEMLELSDAIQEGRPGDCLYRQGRTNPLHLDWRLAAMNASRAFIALVAAGLIWIETAWDGARAGMILVGILCSLMATFPRPLMAAQNYARGLGLALVVSALYQFWLIPQVVDFEMLALLLLPLLYVVAVGLSGPMTAGIGMGLGLSSFLLFGPQNIGAWQNTAIQWFEFAGAYVCGAALSLMVYAWIFPFNPQLRIERLFRETREQVYALLKGPASDERQFAFESRMVDRLTLIIGLLPATRDERSRALFEVNLGCMALGVAMRQLQEQGRANPLLPEALRVQLEQVLRNAGRYIAGRTSVVLPSLLQTLQALGESLDNLHGEQLQAPAEQLRSLFRIRVALLVIAGFLRHYSPYLEPAAEGAPALAH
ncbi:FUSC family protein [Pseudomonas wadenswilerensis]|uniref:FUSC family protein n=1 Tax=Pseudomonas wadenswilerensis TaxID=1785161 RepID=UPI0021603D0D|nr:FUSC family protein [Pseudomonas wadenswilerensis]UVM19515.1 FUSC family protein [Pseudomonas wadenswilerensis]